MGYFLECCIVSMRESGDAVSVRLTSYHFSKPVFISWQFREPKEYSASAVAKILAESTLLVDEENPQTIEGI